MWSQSTVVMFFVLTVSPISYVTHLVRRFTTTDKRSNTTVITYILHEWICFLWLGEKKAPDSNVLWTWKWQKLFPKKFSGIGIYVFCENIHWNISIIMNPHRHDRWQLSSSHIGLKYSCFTSGVVGQDLVVAQVVPQHLIHHSLHSPHSDTTNTEDGHND
jgi:hypothetical protein